MIKRFYTFYIWCGCDDMIVYICLWMFFFFRLGGVWINGWSTKMRLVWKVIMHFFGDLYMMMDDICYDERRQRERSGKMKYIWFQYTQFAWVVCWFRSQRVQYMVQRMWWICNLSYFILLQYSHSACVFICQEQIGFGGGRGGFRFGGWWGSGW